MKVILLKEIKNLGKNGDIVDVRNGFAKNHLFPKQLALLAIKKNIDSLKKNSNIENLNLKTNNLNKLNNTSIIIPMKVKENNELYGSINIKFLDKVFKKLNLLLNVKHIDSEVLIKKIGKYKLEFKNKIYNFKTTIFIILVEKK